MSSTSPENEQTAAIPTIFSHGFRPFFLLGALWAAFAMILWALVLAGDIRLPTRFDPISWHAHEFLFGYLSAVFAGFLLTAVPNWTGRPPLSGWPLLALTGLWGAGRVSIAFSELLAVEVVAFIDCSFSLVLSALILREVISARNWRNLVVPAMLGAFTAANFLFHLDAAGGGAAAQGLGLRLGLAAALMMVAVIGGRIVPAFTRNWLIKAGRAERPAQPMQTYDKAVLLITLVGLLLWVIWPESIHTGLCLFALAAFHTARLLRWRGSSASKEPLIWVLHVGYAFIPLGALVLGVSILFPTMFTVAAAQHVWMAGVIGMMTLAVMTRATLGHTGQRLHASSATVIIYLAVVGSIVSRLAAGAFPDWITTLHTLTAISWVAAFGGFVAVYGPLLLRDRRLISP